MFSGSGLTKTHLLDFIALPLGPHTYWEERNLITKLLGNVQPKEGGKFLHSRRIRLPHTFQTPKRHEDDYCRHFLDEIMIAIGVTANQKKNSFQNVQANQIRNQILHICASQSTSPEPVVAFKHNSSSIVLVTSECKGVGASLHTAKCQAIQMAADSALTLYKLYNVNSKDIVVPYVIMAGYTVQFGVVYLMDECFPCAVTLSRPFCLMDEMSIDDVHCWVGALAEHCFLMSGIVAISISRKNKISTTSTTTAYIEDIILMEDCVIKPVQVRTSCDIGSDIEPQYFAISKARYIMYLFYRLWQTEEAREFVHFPAGIMGYPTNHLEAFCKGKMQWLARKGSKTSDFYKFAEYAGYPLIVYKFLPENDWEPLQALQSKLDPKNKTHSKIIQEILMQLLRAINAFNLAGVIHLDLRASNIMVHIAKDRVKLLVIDWDDAALLGQAIDAAYLEEMNGDERYPQQLTHATIDAHQYFYDIIASSFEKDVSSNPIVKKQRTQAEDISDVPLLPRSSSRIAATKSIVTGQPASQKTKEPTVSKQSSIPITTPKYVLKSDADRKASDPTCDIKGCTNIAQHQKRRVGVSLCEEHKHIKTNDIQH